MSENDSRQKAETLWFSPEVVVLEADTRIFRVFAAILKAQSSVFADMFTFPQPPSAEMETMDGFPVVKLHDDPDEVEVFLKAIFDSSFYMPPPAEPDFDHILGILRLSHKYDVPYLRRRSLQHLDTFYTTTLSTLPAYDIRKGRHESMGRIIAPIRVATEVGAPWLLPSVYYELCTQPISTFVNLQIWKDLGDKERNACLTGHSMQTQYFPKIVDFLFISKDADADAECEDSEECNRVRLDFGRNQWQNMTWVLDAMDDDDWEQLMDSGLCATCIVEAKDLHAAARRGFWDQLPQMFDLPPWEELKEMRRVALSA